MKILLDSGATVSDVFWSEIYNRNYDHVALMLEYNLSDIMIERGWRATVNMSQRYDMNRFAQAILVSGIDVNRPLPCGYTLHDLAILRDADSKIIELLESVKAEVSYKSEIVGVWENPQMNNVPGGVAKMTFNSDGTGESYDKTSDDTPLSIFQYRFSSKAKPFDIHRIIQTYSSDKKWYAIVQVIDFGNIRTLSWGAWGENIDTFPLNWASGVSLVWQGYQQSSRCFSYD
jgi:hypothetical protein